MNVSLILFTLGILFITIGYTNQISPQCNQQPQVKVVPRPVYDELLLNQELTDQVYQDML